MRGRLFIQQLLNGSGQERDGGHCIASLLRDALDRVVPADERAECLQQIARNRTLRGFWEHATGVRDGENMIAVVLACREFDPQLEESFRLTWASLGYEVPELQTVAVSPAPPNVEFESAAGA